MGKHHDAITRVQCCNKILERCIVLICVMHPTVNFLVQEQSPAASQYHIILVISLILWDKSKTKVLFPSKTRKCHYSLKAKEVDYQDSTDVIEFSISTVTNITPKKFSFGSYDVYLSIPTNFYVKLIGIKIRQAHDRCSTGVLEFWISTWTYMWCLDHTIFPYLYQEVYFWDS